MLQGSGKIFLGFRVKKIVGPSPPVEADATGLVLMGLNPAPAQRNRKGRNAVMYILKIIKRFRFYRNVVVSTGLGKGRKPIKGNCNCSVVDIVVAEEHVKGCENTKDACKLAAEI